ncbi:MAG TPA: hypothetical protein VN033_07015 [Vulgatibacter sp.]|nr:hypothetical protein [Vulgatibacter sp.]
MKGLRRLGWVALGCGFMLAPALVVAAPQDAGQEQPSQQQGSTAEQAATCPMMEASMATRQALKEGAEVRVENTPDGAIVRFAAPSGDRQAVQDTRSAAQKLADAAQVGCSCAGAMQRQQRQQRQGQPSGGMPGAGMERGAR